MLGQGLPRLETFERFLSRAKREVTVAHYISPKETHELSVMKGRVKVQVEQGFAQSPVIDCKDHLSNYRQEVERALNQELSSSSSMQRFRVTKYWCVNMSDFSTPKESAERLGLGGSESLTLVVVNWRGLGKRQVVRNSAKGLHLNNRVAMFNACRHHLSLAWRNVISYSPLVLHTSRRFAHSLGLSFPNSPPPSSSSSSSSLALAAASTGTHTHAAIHIRSEKLGLREPRMPGVTKACFEELMRLRDALAAENPALRFVYVTDYAPYSSDTCRKCRGSKEIKKLLLGRNIHTTYFDPSRFNVTLDKGLAAAVEAQFLASADFLFLCGGGGFQSQIATRFLESRGKSATRLFRVCNDDQDITRVLSKHGANEPTIPPGT